MMNLAFPYGFDDHGHTASADYERHVRDMIEQLLFTLPGERVNRPDFGSGLIQLLFAPNSQELAVTVQAMVQGSLHQWMGELITVESVEAKSEDNTLRVTVQYVVLRTQERHVENFMHEMV